jgi:hypothetical protein
VAAYSGDAGNHPAISPCGSEAVTVTAQFLTGRAYGLAATAAVGTLQLVTVAPIPDTGAISTTSSSTVSPACVANLRGLVSADVLCATVTTTAVPAKSTASASVVDAAVRLPQLPTIAIKAVQSSSTTTCGASSGSTTIDYLAVGPNVVISVPTVVAPNTRLSVAGITLVLNEQIPITGAEKGLTVNAIHIVVNPLGANAVTANIVVASSESDIGNCP